MPPSGPTTRSTHAQRELIRVPPARHRAGGRHNPCPPYTPEKAGRGTADVRRRLPDDPPAGRVPRTTPRARQPRASAPPAEFGTPWLLAAPAIILLAALLGYPLIRMIELSFQNMRLRELISGRDAPWVGFDQYTKVLTDSVFWSVVGRTVAFTVVSVIVSVLCGLSIALLMRRVNRSVRLFMIVAMMFVWALPQLVAAQIFRWITDADFGVINYLIDMLPGVDYATTAGSSTRPRAGW